MAASEPVVAPRLSRNNSLSIPLTSEGFIDWDSVSDSQKEKFTEVITNDPVSFEALASTLGDADGPVAVDSLDAELTEANMGELLDSISQLNAVIFSILIPKFKVHPFLRREGKPVPFVIEPEVAIKAFSLDADQHKELDPRALRVAKKYSSNMPDWMKRNLDLYLLMGMFFKYTAKNASTCMSVQLQRDWMRATKPAAGSAPPKSPDSDMPQAPPQQSAPPQPPPPSNGRAGNSVEGESLEPEAARDTSMPPLNINLSPEPDAPRV